MRAVLVLVASMALSCAAILGISDYEEADCVRDCGARIDAAGDAPTDAKSEGG